MVEDEIVAELVEFAGADAGLDIGRDEIQRFRRQQTRLAHALEILQAVDLDGALVAAPIVDAVVGEVAGDVHAALFGIRCRLSQGHARVLKCLRLPRPSPPAC